MTYSKATVPYAVINHKKIEISVVVPILNEKENLEEFYSRLNKVLTNLNSNYEIIFVDDGSQDNSASLLHVLHERDRAVKVITLNRNYGQHAAVFAGLAKSVGQVVVTLDGDLQNPPEEIPNLLLKLEDGYDIVGGWRDGRQDPLIRRVLSFMINRVTSITLGAPMRDHSCMLRAYRRSVIDRLLRHPEVSSFIPALATYFAGSVAEIPVDHARRKAGRSNYDPFRLFRLNFDLLTSFSLLPIQIVSFAGILISFLGLGFAAFLAVRRLIVGPEVEGVFTLFAILFFFVGLQILALGLIGEYIGRIYMEVRRRPRYVIKEVLE